MRVTPALPLLCLLLAASASAAPVASPKPKPAKPADPFDQSQLAGLEWRNIGPDRGGRVVAATGVPSQRNVYYLGGTGGGIWKSVDSGVSWTNVLDGESGTGSWSGAIAVRLRSERGVRRHGRRLHPRQCFAR
jgi:hypothetical protein